MFSGIVQSMGRILVVSPHNTGMQVTIGEHSLPEGQVVCGAQVAVSGEATTIRSVDKAGFFVVVISGRSWPAMAPNQGPWCVNLEPAVQLGQGLGGHLVAGYVDDLVTLVHRQEVGGGCLFLRFAMPKALRVFVAQKGSIAVNGVSVTVNAVEENGFTVNIIPYTAQTTNLSQLVVGQSVTIEVDLIARYVVQYCETMAVSRQVGRVSQ